METPVITDRVSHYTVLSKLGAGGGGEVCPAADKALSRKVAIKFLPADSAADQQRKRHLIRQAPAAVRLDHPTICTIHEVGQEAGHSFIVMQYREAETLRRQIEKPLDFNECPEMGAQVDND